MAALDTLSYQRLRVLLYFIFISLAVYLASSLFIFYLELKTVDYNPPALLETAPTPERQIRSRPLADYRRIWERNLFAVQATQQKAPAEDNLLEQIDKLALTTLNLTLIGTLVRERGKSWAIIKDNQSNRQEKYKTGSMVNGAKVVMILRNKVVLNRDGKDELLVMGIEKIRAEKSGNGKSAQASPEGDVATFTVSKDFMQNSINNIAQIMSNARVKPHFVKGEPAGFKISRIKKGSLFNTMGFKDGDIIEGVNGQAIKSAKDIMRLYNSMKESRFFSIHINRNNERKMLNFRVR